MARSGYFDSLLTAGEGLHAEGCQGRQESERSTCRPIVLPRGPERQTAELVVVYCEWCIECGAADYEVV